MKRTMAAMIVLGALLCASAVDAVAQADAPARARRGPVSAEMLMQMRDRLELTEDQLAALDELRRESVARRSAEMADMAELRSQLRAGQIQRSEVMAYVEERRAAAENVVEERRQRLEGILTESQLETLEEIGARARAFRRGRASAMRGQRPGMRPGNRGVRGRRPGMRGGRPGVRGGRPGIRRGRPGGEVPGGEAG